MKRKSILWFRQDLRLHDNEALSEAMKASDLIIPLYIFDERIFNASTSFGFPKTGPHRTKFIVESVVDLRDSLRSLGSELYIRVGKPEEIIFQIAREQKTSYTFCNRERTKSEIAVQDELEQNLWRVGQEIRYSRGKMLYYTADLPFPVNHTPDHFGSFKKETERIIPIREPLPIDSGLKDKTVRSLEPGEIPSFEGLHKLHSQITIKGGEMNGLMVLNELKEAKDPSQSGIPSISPYLAQGCLSPKKVYHILKSSDSKELKFQDIFLNLIYRDYLRLMAKKHGSKIYDLRGIKQTDPHGGSVDKKLFAKWAKGRTGNTFIDACMNQLNSTGFISMEGRQAVASFLVYDLGLDWRMGAEYFESALIDFDPCSNWVNWQNIAGVGPDSRDKILNSEMIGKRLDPSGEYTKQWLTSLN